MLSVSYLFEEMSSEELDTHINKFMGDLGKSLRNHAEENKTPEQLLKEKIDREKEKTPWLIKNKRRQT